MKRSAQEIIELVVFALIAILVGTLLVWGVGWVFTATGWLFRLIASFLWSLLVFVIPLAIVAGVVYFVVRLLRQPRDARSGSTTFAPAVSPARPAPPPTPGTVSGPVPDPIGSPAPTPVPPYPAQRDVTPPTYEAEPVVDMDPVSQPADSSPVSTSNVSTSNVGSYTAPVDPAIDPDPSMATDADLGMDTSLDTSVDTSGFKEMDDLAERLEEDAALSDAAAPSALEPEMDPAWPDGDAQLESPDPDEDERHQS